MGVSSGGEGQAGRIFTEINITPLTDIFLVLLIIMMVIAPMMNQSNQDIELQPIQSGEAVEANLTTVEITKAGDFYVNGEKTAADRLKDTLQKTLPSAESKQVVVKADKATKSSHVIKVFEAAGAAGFEKMTVAGDPLSGARQSELEKQPQSEGSP